MQHKKPSVPTTALLYRICAVSGCAPMTVRSYYAEPGKVRPASRTRIENALAQLDHDDHTENGHSSNFAPSNARHPLAITSLGWNGRGPR